MVVVLVGVALRLGQWLGNSSLWLDELSLVQNILERSPLELMSGGLDGQVAPVGFLILEKAAVLALGDGELALRVAPLAASISALVAFAYVVRSLLAPIGAFVATACFALNPLLISLSAVVKQYSFDVLVTVLLLGALRLLWTARGSRRSRIAIGATAGFMGLFSIPSAMVAGAAVAALFYRAWTSGRVESEGGRASFLLPALSWGGAAAMAALSAYALLTPSVRDFMEAYWTGAGAFAPPLSEYPTWVLDELGSRLFRGWFVSPYALSGARVPGGWLALAASPPVVLGCVGVTAWTLGRRHGVGWVLAVFLPLLFALGLSRLQIYPLETRTAVFLLPLLILLVGALAEAAATPISPRRPVLRRVIPGGATALLGAVLVVNHPVYHTQPTRELIRELAERRAPDEPVFAHAWVRPALFYYGRRFGVGDDVRVATRDDLTGLLAELDGFKGRPALWVVFAHPPRERDFVLCYLGEIATEVDRVVLAGGMSGRPVSLHRYDMSDPVLWSNADAATFPRSEGAFEGPSPRCTRLVA